MSELSRRVVGAPHGGAGATAHVLDGSAAALHDAPFPWTASVRSRPVDDASDGGEDPAGVAHEHHRRPGAGAQVWWCRPTSEALVLGSAQRSPGQGPGTSPSVDVVVRRSGGGAVWVSPLDTMWVDVVLPRSWPGWSDDVHRASVWVGERWAAVLETLGFGGVVHRGGLRADALGRAVCFAGVGPGEVLVEGRKVVGVSQRRERGGARVQTMAYLDAVPAAATAAALGPLADPLGGSDAVTAALEARAAALPVGPERLWSALCEELLDDLVAIAPEARDSTWSRPVAAAPRPTAPDARPDGAGG